MNELKESLIIDQRSWSVYASLYIVSLFLCFVGGYFLGVNRSIKVWLAKEQEDHQELCVQHTPTEPPIESDNTQKDKKYYKALIIGGTKKIVEPFVAKMKLHNIDLDIQQKVSKTKKGKEYCWYQATTSAFENKQELQKLVAVLKKHGKLKDVQIVQCS